MPIVYVNNPMVENIIETLKKVDTSHYDMYLSVLRATPFIASEAAKNLDYYSTSVSTVYGKSNSQALNKNINIVTHLRSGLPMSESLRHFFMCGKISYVLLDRDIASNILYSSIGNLNRFENCIICEPLLVDEAPIKMIIEHVLSKGAAQKRVFVLSLVAASDEIESLNKEYPDVTFYLNNEDNFFKKYCNDDKNLDCIGEVIFGDHSELNSLKIKRFYE